MKIFKSILKRVLAFIIIVPLVLWALSSLFSYAQISLGYPTDPLSNTAMIDQTSNWMKDVSDDVRLSEMALPGTHDSATQYVHLPYLAQCQALSLEDQLKSGYRYLDIRLKAEPDTKTMTFHHGPAACQKDRGLFAPTMDLNDGLEQCYRFLVEHPTETVVFVVKQEDSKLAPSDFQDILAQYINQKPEAWYIDTKIPTLGEARGKIVLMQRHKLDKLYKVAGPALLWQDQRQTKPEEGKLPYEVTREIGAPSVAVQDAFQYSVEDKWDAFEQSAQAMSTQLADDMVKLNFLSTKGPTPVGHPFGYAKSLNPKLFDSSINFAHTWTIVDFATPDMAAKILKANFDK